MLNRVTLVITEEEVQKEYNQHKAKECFEWAELAFIPSYLILGMQALHYWVFNRVNIP